MDSSVGLAGLEIREDGGTSSMSDAASAPRRAGGPANGSDGTPREIRRGRARAGRARANLRIPLRTLIVNDSRVFLGTLRRLLETMSEIDVVGTAFSGREALELVARVHPDMVLMDMAMPEMDGLQACRLLAASPDPADAHHHDHP